MIRAMPTARALALSGRACLRVSAAVAASITIAGCSDASKEADPICYETVAGYARQQGHVGDLALAALSDGFLSNAEYRQVTDAADAVREVEYRQTRARIKAGAR